MASIKICRQCGHFQPDNTPPVFADPIVELAHIDQQIDQINSQIHRLQDLRSTFQYRANQLRSPIYAIPVEVISDIFRLCTPGRGLIGRTGWEMIRSTHHCAITLSSVSSHWRQIAFATPGLWERISFEVTETSVDATAALLQHCAPHANHLKILFDNDFGQSPPFATPEGIRPITRVLFSPNVARKIKALYLYSPLPDWIPMLSSFPLLDTLAIVNNSLNSMSIRLQAPSLSRVYLQVKHLTSITLPPSVQVLHLDGVELQDKMSLLHQCPNLVECVSDRGRSLSHISLTTPLTLNRLKKLAWPIDEAPGDTASIRNLRTPALEHLELVHSRDRLVAPPTAITLCHQLSATLSSLTLKYFTAEWTVFNLRELFDFHIPNLQILKLERWSAESLFEAVRALIPNQDEYSNQEIVRLPRLRSLTLTADGCSNVANYGLFPRLLLDLLEGRRAGESFRFDINFTIWFGMNVEQFWSPELREELRLIVNNRRVIVKHASKDVEWL